METTVSDIFLATPVPEVVEAVSEAAVDYSEIITRLDTLINIGFSTYVWVALFITLVLGAWVIYQILKPLIYFLR